MVRRRDSFFDRLPPDLWDIFEFAEEQVVSAQNSIS